MLTKLLSLALPWSLRRRFLERRFGYSIHPTSRIGLSWIFPKRLIVDEHARIGHLNVCKGVELLHLGASAVIGQLNWITGFPREESRHFAHQVERMPQLIVERHAGISSRHLLDCTASVRIGAFATLGGFRSQILTHSIDLAENRQAAHPITIGDYCFVGTDCVLLGGSALPHHSVLGAKSLLNKSYEQPFTLYAGVPAQPIKALPQDLGYFKRAEGFVW